MVTRQDLQPELDLSKLALVTFDLGHTLTFSRLDILAEIIAEGFDKPVTAKDVVQAEMEFRKLSKPFETRNNPAIGIPQNSYEYYAFLVEKCTGMKVSALGEKFEWFAKYAHGYHLRKNWLMYLGPDAIPALDMLKPRFRLAIISNAHGTVDRDLRILGIRDYFEFVVDSEIVGFAKPDPRIFRHALDLASVKPEWAVHIGDHPVADVCGALEVGMHALHYDALGVFRSSPDIRAPSFRNLVDLAEALIGQPSASLGP